MVLRVMQDHQFAVILLVKLGTLGDISANKRHATSNGVQPSLWDLAWAHGMGSPPRQLNPS